jgi:hypothetical protein
MIATDAPPPLPLICALLRGESPAWPAGLASSDDGRIGAFLATARTHGVTPLLDARFVRSDGPSSNLPGGDGTSGSGTCGWPDAIRRACHDEALAQTAHELARGRELARVLAAFTAAGVAPLILKGAALAYSHYPSPALRPRGDTDILVPPAAATLSERVLRELGYTRGGGVSGDLVSYQAAWSRTDPIGQVHHVDVHWRISNSQILAKALTYDELAGRAQAVPALGPHARVPAPVDALLFACMHRAGHVNVPYDAVDETFIGGDRLIWLYDMHLLVGAMSVPELEDFVRRATAKRLKTICLDALERTRECFATPIPQAVLAGLQPAGIAEPSARYLTGRRGWQMLGDFLALDGWSTRLQWLKELGFPAPDYMHRKYSDATICWLPVLYARRAASGLRKALFRRGPDGRA